MINIDNNKCLIGHNYHEGNVFVNRIDQFGTDDLTMISQVEISDDLTILILNFINPNCFIRHVNSHKQGFVC